MLNLRLFTNKVKLLFCLTLCFTTFGCDFDELTYKNQPGVVAMVNDVPITLSDIEKRRVTLGAFFDDTALANEQELLEQYKYVLSQILEEEIILWYMNKKNIIVPIQKIEEEKNKIISDYQSLDFLNVLAEHGITEADWEKQTIRRIYVEYFFNNIIRPEIKISKDEVADYFNNHKNEFVVPEQWTFFELSGIDKAEVEKARADLIKNKNATSTQNNFNVTIRDIRTNYSALLEDYRKELSNLSEWESTKIKKRNDLFQLRILKEKIPSKAMDAAAIYERVEGVLAERKMRDYFYNWLDKNALRVKIKVVNQLLF